MLPEITPTDQQPTESVLTREDPPEPPALALALLGLIGAGATHLCGLVSVFLSRLVELPERLARAGDLGF